MLRRRDIAAAAAAEPIAAALTLFFASDAAPPLFLDAFFAIFAAADVSADYATSSFTPAA